ncbi:UNVERIFIED_CONTAM: hypothetical protein Scaly_2328600 [Sesamum calycinum]|uniref:THH1/TOM1/TOM3 domain-containing protein n=1 Tax=Sesamum calycinum TaxID=2727403 RepID=A0AAW2MEB9_9LAMI
MIKAAKLLCMKHCNAYSVLALLVMKSVSNLRNLMEARVDLCHQSNDDDEDEYSSSQETLLETTNISDSNTNSIRKCFSFVSIRIGSRQKVVILVAVLVFAIMVASSVLIWIGMGKNPIDSAVVAQACYLAFSFSLILILFMLKPITLLLRLLLFLKMRKVRSERASTEMWKVAGLAIVSVICFTSSACVAIATNIPLFYHWHEQQIDGVYTSLLLVLYYFIGSSVPSAFVLLVMRELPPPLVINRRQESRTIAFIRDHSVAAHPQHWTATTSVQAQAVMLLAFLYLSL